MYLILCEGVFKNLARLVLGFRAIGDGEINADWLARRLDPKVMVNELHDKQLDAFAVGYHRHIRNAIAHGYLRFQPSTEEMRFRDFKPSDPATPVFDESWPFARLAWLYAKLDDTYLIVSTCLQIAFLPLAFDQTVH
jgi:hypothetical protein